MKALTLQEWNDAGFMVKKGEVSVTRNRYDEATFTRDQVREMKSFDYRHDGLRRSKDERDR